MAVVEHPLSMNCAKGTTLSVPEDRSAPYVATFLMDCETFRTQN